MTLPSGRTIALFFYDGAISRDVAFGGLLHSGAAVRRATALAGNRRTAEAGLVHIATDGETYGHHHPHGDMALAFALRAIGAAEGVRLTNYGEFLEKHPPAVEVEIRENTSWSCAHGIERWGSDCGCASGAHPLWNQAWRAPLREALDALRDRVAGPFEQEAGELLRDPWEARDAYVDVVLDRSPANVARFFDAHARRPLSDGERTVALKLLELQRHAMLMYTSCGWFFDDLAGIEAVQVLQYAGRVVQLAEELFGGSFEEPFRESLAKAQSNRPDEGDGGQVYDRHVLPARVDLPKLGGHYAVRSLFEPYAPEARIYCYEVEREDFRIAETGKMKLGLGRARFTSEITGESQRLAFGALHLGDHNVHGGVEPAPEDAAYLAATAAVEHAFARADVPEVLRLLDAGLGRHAVSLKLLFREEQRRILRIILESSREEAEEALRQIHERHLPLMRFLADLGSPLPRVFRATAEFVINAGLRRALGAETLDASGVGALLDEAAREKVPLDAETLEYLFVQRLERFAREFAERPEDPERLETLRRAVELSVRLPFPVRLWQAQNAFWRALQEAYPSVHARATAGDAAARAWIEGATALAERLAVRMPGEVGRSWPSPPALPLRLARSSRRSIFAATMKSFSCRPPIAVRPEHEVDLVPVDRDVRDGVPRLRRFRPPG